MERQLTEANQVEVVEPGGFATFPAFPANRLGLKRQAKDITPPLAEYLAHKAHSEAAE